MNTETITISLSTRVNLGNYESSDLYLAVKDVPVGVSPDRIQTYVETAGVVFDAIKSEFRAKVVELSAGMSPANRERLRAEINAEHALNGATK